MQSVNVGQGRAERCRARYRATIGARRRGRCLGRGRFSTRAATNHRHSEYREDATYDKGPPRSCWLHLQSPPFGPRVGSLWPMRPPTPDRNSRDCGDRSMGPYPGLPPKEQSASSGYTHHTRAIPLMNAADARTRLGDTRQALNETSQFRTEFEAVITEAIRRLPTGRGIW